jgi:apolipoprotein D and lipocalin family protein
MKSTLPLCFLFCVLFVSLIKGQDMETVKQVDLERYAGLWYEIAKIPNSFQKKCIAGTTAEYVPMDNGKIKVINRCQEADGNKDSATGIARVVDAETNAKLQVSFVRFFCRNWFWGDYWIIGLDTDYQWAIVGHPKRTYGWILARTPELAPDVLDTCHSILRKQGYDPTDFVMTDH